MSGLADKTLGQLIEYLEKLRADLAEVEEERLFVLGQTGLHVSANEVTKYESEVKNLTTRIEEVERVLLAKQAE